MKRITAVLGCCALLAIAVPTAAAAGTLRSLPDLSEPAPVPVAHPELGATAGCDLGVNSFGYFVDPPSDDCLEAAAHTWGIEAISLHCEDWCYIFVIGTDGSDWGEVYIECGAESGGGWAFADDALLELIAPLSEYGECTFFEWGPSPSTWTMWEGFGESGHEVSFRAYADWRDWLVEGLL